MKSETSLVDDRHYRRTILLLAWPIFLEQLLVSMVQAADTAMVGSLGKIATAAVAINSPPNMMITAVVMALGVGFTSMIARSIGAGNVSRAHHLTKQAFLIVIAVSIPLTVFCFVFAREIPMWMGGEAEILDSAEIYNQILAVSLLFRSMTMALTAIYRGYGDSKTPMIINVMVNVLNVIGNFLMIYPTRELTVFGRSFTMFGFGWGVAGAAVSTTLSEILGGTLLTILCFTGFSPMHLSLRSSFVPDWTELRAVCSLSFPVMLERFIMSSAFIVVGHSIATLGTAAVAAQNLCGTAESISFMPGFAFGSSTTTLFGQSIGARRNDAAHRYVVETIKMGSVIMLVTTFILFFCAYDIIGIFTPDPEVRQMGGTLLRIVAVIQVPQMIAQVFSGALKGAGDSRSPFVITLISMWGVRLLGTVLCVRVLHMGLNAACVCMCLDNVVRFFLFLFRYRQGNWKVPEQPEGGAA